MPMIAVGKTVVASPGTPQALKNAQVNCASVTLQAALGNTQNIYIGDSTLVVSTGVGLIATLGPGMAWSTPVVQGNSLDLNKVFIDADNGTDSINGSYLQM